VQNSNLNAFSVVAKNSNNNLKTDYAVTLNKNYSLGTIIVKPSISGMILTSTVCSASSGSTNVNIMCSKEGEYLEITGSSSIDSFVIGPILNPFSNPDINISLSNGNHFTQTILLS